MSDLPNNKRDYNIARMLYGAVFGFFFFMTIPSLIMRAGLILNAGLGSNVLKRAAAEQVASFPQGGGHVPTSAVKSSTLTFS